MGELLPAQNEFKGEQEAGHERKWAATHKNKYLKWNIIRCVPSGTRTTAKRRHTTKAPAMSVQKYAKHARLK